MQEEENKEQSPAADDEQLQLLNIWLGLSLPKGNLPFSNLPFGKL